MPWLGLAAICALFVIAVVRLHPANFFGFTEDDSIYFSSAKALAAGKGYELASFPGTPVATKYPVFYPWLLSWIWRLNPSFPANLTDAIAVTVFFGLWYLVASFVFLRRLAGLSDRESLLVTAFCGLHPLFLFYSSQVLSDIPFAAFAITAIVFSEASLQGRRADAKIAASGLFSGLAILMRILGVPVAVGIGVSLATRRCWRQLVAFCASVAPFFAVITWGVIFPHPAVSPAVGPAATTRTWIQTWAYYTNYVNVWKEGVQGTSGLFTVLKINALALSRAPADYFLRPWPATRSFAGQVVAVLLTVVIIKGALRLASDSKVWTYQIILALYATVLFFWVYINEQRFLILFLPLFAAALLVEVESVWHNLKEDLTEACSLPRKVAGSALGMVSVAFVAILLLDFGGGVRRETTELSRSRGALLPEKRQAYDWLARSDQNTRVLAIEDGVLYLYSGRTAVRPYTFPAALQDSTTDIVDVENVARAIGAEYWLVSEGNSDPNWLKILAGTAAQKGSGELPLVFSSAAGRVRIYSLGCILPDDRACASANSISQEHAIPGATAIVREAPR